LNKKGQMANQIKNFIFIAILIMFGLGLANHFWGGTGQDVKKCTGGECVPKVDCEENSIIENQVCKLVGGKDSSEEPLVCCHQKKAQVPFYANENV